MKAIELMVNDYVLYDGKILQVGQLSGYDIKIDLLNGDNLYTQFCDEDMDNIEGVWLTPEILAKVGLKEQKVEGEKGSVQTYWIDAHIVGYYNMSPLERLHHSCVVYQPTEWKGKLHSSGWLFLNGDTGRIEVACDFLHQLQHAFRMLGFKEVELNKDK